MAPDKVNNSDKPSTSASSLREHLSHNHRKIMTILITGGTGKTGLALAGLLHDSGYSFLITSRKGTAPAPYKAIKFDWFKPETFEAPFQSDSNIDKVFLIDPPAFDIFPRVKPFIDIALSRGVKRFVGLTTTQTNPKDVPLGKVHQYLLDLGVDYAILRPTWFIENFGTDLQPSIRDDDEIASSGEDGKVPFVSVKDIAAAAFIALTAEESLNKDIFVIGPNLYSYDEACISLLDDTLGRLTWRNSLRTVEEQTEMFQQFLSPEYAAHLARVEHLIADGGEEKFFYESEDRKYVGKHTLAEYIESNRALWMK
ncbi:Agroclavine dehydrogenase [Psilocybe cubensis]|uniref:Agroclavine dehydrogenase n=2 Tax=Psilocybe cubensis TaxID=181762 RepID=A0ACB8GQK0_PSICU|nr:Agroclavine dehydrogenase [Psilocybe cubensis]KAH9477750.1 Agroclavine dehydrogenase [Psilocybe cubensis]